MIFQTLSQLCVVVVGIYTKRWSLHMRGYQKLFAGRHVVPVTLLPICVDVGSNRAKLVWGITCKWHRTARRAAAAAATIVAIHKSEHASSPAVPTSRFF